MEGNVGIYFDNDGENNLWTTSATRMTMIGGVEEKHVFSIVQYGSKGDSRLVVMSADTAMTMARDILECYGLPSPVGKEER